MRGMYLFSQDELDTLRLAPVWVISAVAVPDGQADRGEGGALSARLRAALDEELRRMIAPLEAELEPSEPRDEFALASVRMAECWSLYDAVVLSAFVDCSTAEARWQQLIEQWARDPRDPIAGLAAVGGILEEKVPPEQAREFKERLMGLGGNVAETPAAGLQGPSGGASRRNENALQSVAGALGIDE